MMTPYQPKYKWRPTKIDDKDPPTDLDFTGLDGTAYLGRIRKETNGTTKGKWHWAGSWPRTCMGKPPTPNAGYVDTARQATQKVEEYWELCHEVMTPRSEGR
ncbi:hypothetical protein [Rhizobium mesoamericanum]|uniref:Uncharacterized protein n=1 Tax=Rhizobium mesoamericanum STM3625 TaxID=1211777 RepID=K0Q3B2_9HYPH|nr:hypothetical protein [Rhizobium mesoamericanum]CCM77139.1 conserved hypothetical protein [Rhizobium mesoamericanum STM3625]